MCVYCYCGDHIFRYDPPWNPPYPHPAIPMPINPAPVTPWDLQRLHEFADLLRRVKELEDKLGCPCEPNKADYLAIFRERIEELERCTAASSSPNKEADQ